MPHYIHAVCFLDYMAFSAHSLLKQTATDLTAVPCCMQLAAKAVKMMQEQQAQPQPTENLPAVKSPAIAAQNASDQQLVSVKDQPTKPGPTSCLDTETGLTADIPTGAVQHTNAVNPERPYLADALHIFPGPVAFRSLKRSASMPAFPTVQIADQHVGNMPTATAAQIASQNDTGRNRAQQVAKAEPPNIGQRTAVQKALGVAIPYAADQSHLHGSHSVPIAMLPNWTAVPAPAVASAADSIMSNFPKESTASIALPNPFAVSTNIHPNLDMGAASLVPQSYLYTEAALRSSLTSSAGNCQVGTASLFAHDEKENSPKPKAESGFMQSNALAIFGPRAGSLNLVGKLQNAFANRSSGRDSTMSGTASEHALSAKNCPSGGSLMQAGSAAGAGPESVTKASDALQNAEYEHAGNAACKRVKLN